MDTETINRVRAMIADSKARIASLETDINLAKQAGLNTKDLEASLAQAKDQIASVERVYGSY